MRTKSGKSHWKCTTVWESGGRRVVNPDFRFVAFDGEAHMMAVKKHYGAAVNFYWTDLVNLEGDA